MVHQACRGAGVPAGVEDFSEGFRFGKLQAAHQLLVVPGKEVVDDIGEPVDGVFQVIPCGDGVDSPRGGVWDAVADVVVVCISVTSFRE